MRKVKKQEVKRQSSIKMTLACRIYYFALPSDLRPETLPDGDAGDAVVEKAVRRLGALYEATAERRIEELCRRIKDLEGR